MDKELEDLLKKEVNEFDVDWSEILAKPLRRWKLVLKVSSAFTALGLIWALLSAPSYQSKVILAPESQGRTSGNLSSITSMLGIGGSSLGNSSPDALNMALFPDICGSTQFLTDLLDVEVAPFVDPNDRNKGLMEPLRLYDYLQQPKGIGKILALVRSVIPDTAHVNAVNLTKRQSKILKKMKGRIAANVNQTNGVTTITVTMTDPNVAYQLAETVCERLQERVIQYRTQKEQKLLDYYERMAEDYREKMIQSKAAYDRSVDFDRSVILQSVRSEKERLNAEAQMATQLYQQMETQRELSIAKLQEVKPVFATIEPAAIPVTTADSRFAKLVAMLFLGIFGSLTWIYCGGYFCKFTNSVKEKVKIK